MTAIKKEFKGNIGLFLVCAEVSKKNMIALPTSRNTRGLDLVILKPENNKSIGLQVKCSDQNEYPVFSSYWHNYHEVIEEKIISPFIFVDISVITEPKYFILTAEETRKILRKIIGDYISLYTKRHRVSKKKIFEKEMSKDKDNKKKPDVWAIKQEKIEQYLNNWAAIGFTK